MATPSIRIKGLREAQRAFRKADGGLLPMFREELKEAAEPVRATFAERVGRYQGASVTTIKSVVRMNAVAVQQQARKVTGLRGDFGSLQMRHAIASLVEHEHEIEGRIEDALDGFLDRSGL